VATEKSVSKSSVPVDVFLDRAGFWDRFNAKVIDIIVPYLCTIALANFIYYRSSFPRLEPAINLLLILSIFLGISLVHSLCEQTLGKMIVGIKVLHGSAGRIGHRRSLVVRVRSRSKIISVSLTLLSLFVISLFLREVNAYLYRFSTAPPRGWADRSAKSELRNAAIAEEAFFAENDRYTPALSDLNSVGFNQSSDIRTVLCPGQRGMNESFRIFSEHRRGDKLWFTDSQTGKIISGKVEKLPMSSDEFRYSQRAVAAQEAFFTNYDRYTTELSDLSRVGFKPDPSVRILMCVDNEGTNKDFAIVGKHVKSDRLWIFEKGVEGITAAKFLLDFKF